MSRKLYWIITNYCNLGCRYCYYNTGLLKRNPRHIQLESYAKVIPQLTAHFSEVILTGGEVLLHPQLFQLIRACRQQGLSVSILTNGVLLSSAMVKRLLAEGVSALSISLDSLDSETNNQQRGQGELVLKNLKTLLRLKSPSLTVEIMQTVTRKNLSSIVPLYRFCKQHGLVHWVDPVEINPQIKEIQGMALEKLTEPERQKLEQALLIWAGKNRILVRYSQEVLRLIMGLPAKNLRCQMGTEHFVLDLSGDLYPCFLRRDLNLGSVLTKPLGTLINNSHYQKKIRPLLMQAKCVSLGCVCMTMVDDL